MPTVHAEGAKVVQKPWKLIMSVYGEFGEASTLVKEFATKEERDAYLEGVTDMDGWSGGYDNIVEFEEMS